MPIYVGYDSADVWSNRELFQLDDSGKMIYQGGCPPGDYKHDGQIWGNPLYNWDVHQDKNYAWWKLRFKKLFEMVDIVRLDHFIGYSKYYRIPINEKTAKNGEWIPGPGAKLFHAILSGSNEFNVIAEDLGDVNEDVVNLREQFNFPGMRVLLFELDDVQPAHTYPKNSVVCTSTHDSDTIRGWFQSLSEIRSNGNVLYKDDLLDYFQCLFQR